MSTPNEFPSPEQPGSAPQPDGSGSPSVTPAPQAPPPGYQAPPPGYQAPPPGYQAPPPGYQAPPPGYQAPPPGYQAPPAGYQQPAAPGSASFQMPTDWPHGMNEVMPSGGFGGMFKLGTIPQLLKISYIIWLISAGLWLLVSIFAFFGSLFLLGASDTVILGIPIEGTGAALRGIGVQGIITSIISIVLVAAVVVCAMKLKEGKSWARLVLSVIAVLSIVLLFFGAGGGLLGVVASILMWLPESSAWLDARSKGLAN